MSEHEAGPGPGERGPSRSDLNLWAQALRNDWPVPPAVKRRLLQIAVNLADPPDEEPIPAPPTPPPAGPGAAPPAETYALSDRIGLTAKRDRVKLAALRVIAQFGKLTVEQQRLDLARERLAGKPDDATDRAGGVDPALAEQALKVLNGGDHLLRDP